MSETEEAAEGRDAGGPDQLGQGVKEGRESGRGG